MGCGSAGIARFFQHQLSYETKRGLLQRLCGFNEGISANWDGQAFATPASYHAAIVCLASSSRGLSTPQGIRRGNRMPRGIACMACGETPPLPVCLRRLAAIVSARDPCCDSEIAGRGAE